MAFTTITVTGTYLQADNSTPATGNVTFLASTTMTDSSNDQIVAPTFVTGTLNGAGTFSVSLTATDDSTTQPTGVTYEVTENIDGAGQNKYNIAVPVNLPTSLPVIVYPPSTFPLPLTISNTLLS